MRRLIGGALLAMALTASDARADGLPLVDYGTRPDSIVLPGGDQRVEVTKRKHDSIVERRVRSRVRASRRLGGDWAIPAVAYDGSAGGVSADGSTLTLIKPRRAFPRKTTELLLLGRDLHVRRRIDLEGDFSFDAIAPDGSAVFLVEYPNRRDPSVYRVRVYDVAEDQLLAKPLLDSRVAAVVMRGLPVTRASGPGGRVEYTLYDGFGDPFVHALDTAQRSALCIPLPDPPKGVQVMELRLARSGRDMVLTENGWTLAVLDTESNTARRPAAPWVRLASAVFPGLLVPL